MNLTGDFDMSRVSLEPSRSPAKPVYQFIGVLRGTRSILRSDQWLSRWGRVDIQILEAITPEGTDFASILRLRDAVRAAVLAHCGEPDLRELVKPLRDGST